MKAILVMDMPKDCGDCPLMNASDECMVQDKSISIDADSWYDIWDGCPLVQMPERKEEMHFKAALKQPYKNGVYSGWNACLDTIEGSKG